MARVGFWERVRAETRVDEGDREDSVAVMLFGVSVLGVPIWLNIVSGMGGGVSFAGREE